MESCIVPEIKCIIWTNYIELNTAICSYDNLDGRLIDTPQLITLNLIRVQLFHVPIYWVKIASMILNIQSQRAPEEQEENSC